MTSKLDSSVGDRARGRAYTREFVPWMAGYCVVLILVLTLGRLDGPSGWRYLWAVLPVLPLIGVAAAVIRHVRRLDEYQQRSMLIAFSVGFVAMLGAAVTMGFLAIAGWQPIFAPWLVFGIGMTAWTVAAAAVARR